MKLEINSRKTQICEIRQHTLEQQTVKEEIRGNWKVSCDKCNKNTSSKTCDAAKAVLAWNCTAVHAYN